jgi:hypothetical protein
MRRLAGLGAPSGELAPGYPTEQAHRHRIRVDSIAACGHAGPQGVDPGAALRGEREARRIRLIAAPKY